MLTPEDEARAREAGLTPVAIRTVSLWGLLHDARFVSELWLADDEQAIASVTRASVSASFVPPGGVIGRHYLNTILDDGYLISTWSAFSSSMVVATMNETFAKRGEVHRGEGDLVQDLARHRQIVARVAKARGARALSLRDPAAQQALNAYENRVSTTDPLQVGANLVFNGVAPALAAAAIAAIAFATTSTLLPALALLPTAALTALWTLLALLALQAALSRFNRAQLSHYSTAQTADEAPTTWWEKEEDELLEEMNRRLPPWLNPALRILLIALGFALAQLLMGASPAKILQVFAGGVVGGGLYELVSWWWVRRKS